MEERKKKKDESAHVENGLPQDKVIHYCFEHPDEEVKLYCETCEKLICLQCVIKCGKHHDHNYAPVDQAFEKYKEEISSSLQPVEKQMATIRLSREELHRYRGKINHQQAIIEADIHNSIGRLQEILEVRKAQLLSQLHQITQSKLKRLQTQEDQLETTQAQLGNCVDFVKMSWESDQYSEVLQMKKSVVSQVQKLTAPLQPNLLKPCTRANTMYSESEKLFTDCQNFGQISFREDFSESYATGNSLTVSRVEKNSSVILHALNSEGEPCVQPISSLECELISEIVGTRVFGTVKRIQQSRYEISYKPTIKGRHHLHVRVEGQHIRGSPFSVAVKSSIQKLGTPFHSIRGVDGPCGVALTSKQDLVVSGHHDNNIHVFSPDGKKLLSFGSRGSRRGQFKFPAGVTVDKEGNILVVDTRNYRVQKFTAEGQFITAMGTKGKAPSEFDDLYGIAFNTINDKVYITDSSNCRVQIFNSDLTFFTSIDHLGTDKKFSYPRGIACDSSGRLYVADSGNDCVLVFTAEGDFIRAFGSNGTDEGELDGPCGIAIDSNGMVYVSEFYNYRVSVFTPEGQFMKAFGGEGSNPGQFECPNGLAVDVSGVVYVCDYNSIQMF